MIVRIYDHPFSTEDPTTVDVDNLAEWLLDYYQHRPNVRVQIFVGEPSAESEITSDFSALINADQPEYTILQSPGWEGFLVKLLITVVLTVVASLLTPKPELPGNVNRTQSSPNNALAGRENRVRVLERVEDIYGTVLSIPSLMMPTYLKYINHEKYEYGYYCVGRGYYSIADIKDGDTFISDIDGSSCAVYNPFTSPNSGSPILLIGDSIIDAVISTSRSPQVDGITLKALNQVQISPLGSYSFTPNPAGGTITQEALNPNFDAVASVGDTLTVTMSDYIVSCPSGEVTAVASTNSFVSTLSTLFESVIEGGTVVVTGFSAPVNNGTFTVVTKVSDSQITVSGATLIDETGSDVVVASHYDYSGNYTITGVSNGQITLNSAETDFWIIEIPSHPAVIALDGVTNYTDWVILPAPDRTEVWFNIVAPNGIYADNGGKLAITVSFSIEIEQLSSLLVPLGVVEVVSSTLSGSVSDERADTVEHATGWTGPARVRVRRTSAYLYEFEGTVVDEIKWGDLYSVSPVVTAHFGNKTTMHTVTKATARATAVRSRQLNCLASRLIPTYNGSSFSGVLNSDGLLVSGTLSASSKVCDILAAISVDPKIGNRDLATEVDMAQIWATQQALDAWNTQCGQFNYTFDSDTISFEESVILVANAAFCVAYRQNGKIRLALDKAQATSSAMFTHRNKKPSSETVTRTFSSDSDYDGVEFLYVDQESMRSETIILPTGGGYSKLKKFEIAGIRSFTQAWLRANREYQKLLGQRITIETTTTLDARSLLPGARVDIVDNTRFKSYDGEVVGQSGLTLTLSRDVSFLPSTPHSIVLMRRDGSLESIAVTYGGAPNKVTLQNYPVEAIVTSPSEDGIRTIFSFAADSMRGAMAYLVQEIDITDPQYITIRAVNYSPDYYQFDSAEIPAKETIIN
jgi:hypothetical protein